MGFSMLYKSIVSTPWEVKQWPNFTVKDIACQRGDCPACHGETFIDGQSLDNLQAMRGILRMPIFVESGHRCEWHNHNIGGAKNSAHLQLAFDLALGTHDRASLYVAAKQAGFKHFGFMKYGLHIDMRSAGAAQQFWSYGPTSRELWSAAWKEIGLYFGDVFDIGGT